MYTPDLIKAVDKARDIHFKKCKRHNNLQPFYKLWESLAYDVAMTDVIKYWKAIEDE